MKKVLKFLLVIMAVIALTGCWPGEIGVETVFDNKSGAGTRTIILDVMDDTLSQTAIPNPDDPLGVEDKGPVINNKHITGGLTKIQDWLEENAPTFITVEAMKTEGYHRYFTLTYSFDSFEDFLNKYEILVNLSPTMSWDDFDADEKPTWTVDGSKATFTESKVILEASLDWAIDGIWLTIYDAADLAGFVTKADITVLANYKVKLSEGEYEELQHYDPDAVDNEGTGKMIYVTSETFTVTGEYASANTWALVVAIIAGASLVGGVAYMLFRKKTV